VLIQKKIDNNTPNLMGPTKLEHAPISPSILVKPASAVLPAPSINPQTHISPVKIKLATPKRSPAKPSDPPHTPVQLHTSTRLKAKMDKVSTPSSKLVGKQVKVFWPDYNKWVLRDFFSKFSTSP